MHSTFRHRGIASRVLIILGGIVVLLLTAVFVFSCRDSKPMAYSSTSTMLFPPSSAPGPVAVSDFARVLKTVDAALVQKGYSVSRTGNQSLIANKSMSSETQMAVSFSVEKYHPSDNLDTEFIRAKVGLTGRFQPPQFAKHPFAQLPDVAVEGEQARTLIVQALSPTASSR